MHRVGLLKIRNHRCCSHVFIFLHLASETSCGTSSVVYFLRVTTLAVTDWIDFLLFKFQACIETLKKKAAELLFFH